MDTGSRIKLLSSSFNPFEHHQKECLCPENQIDTHREQTPFWLYSIITTTTTLPLGLPFIHVSSQRWGHWDWGITKNGECIKEEPHTTPFLKQLHFNVSLQWMSLHAIFGKKTLLFWSDIITILFRFSFKCFDDRSFWWHGNSHKTPFGNTKKVNGHYFQCIAPFNTWIIRLPLPLKN